MLKGLLLKNIFFLSLLLVLILGCSEKSDNENNNTDTMILENEENTTEDINLSTSFLLIDTKNRELNVTMDKSTVITEQIRQPLVLFNLFSSLCKPCMGQIPYLNEMQKLYQDKLFVVGVLVPTTEDKDGVAKEMQERLIEYFISYSMDNGHFIKYLLKALKLPPNFSMPLSVLYRNGKLHRYYEGAIPMEMLEIEIQNAQKLL